MYTYQIADVLAPAELEQVRALAASGKFSDGKGSAVGAAASVKANQQAELSPEQHGALANIVFPALRRHREFKRLALPVELSVLMINRYAPGMKYGAHYDAPFMAAPNGKEIRADLSATLFLTPPADYDGGELCIVTASQEQRVKLKAGDLCLYPSGHLHQVAEVTRGARLAVVFWVQSMIRDHEKRHLVSDLDGVVGSLAERMPGSVELRNASGVVNALMRLWGEI